MSLERVDFSNGVKSEIINSNFSALNNEIKKERLNIGGSGIASGLGFSLDGFTCRMSQGSVIDYDGNEILIDEKVFSLELPELFEETTTAKIDRNGKIILKNKPYDFSRERTADENSQNITVYVDGSPVQINSIDGKIVNVSAGYVGKISVVKYNYTLPRIDTVYLNSKNMVYIAKGTSSSSPSKYIPNSSDCKQILFYFKIDPYLIAENKYERAGISASDNSDNYRKVYTDDNNYFYICGELFSDLQIIHFKQPKIKKENQFWYDVINNRLLVCKKINGILDWTDINDLRYVRAEERKIWAPQLNPEDLTTFIFHNTEDLNMHFLIGKNELTVMVDQYSVHSDQFSEISLKDALTDTNLRSILIQKGYNLEEPYGEEIYENRGIGFKFTEPLNAASYVEARVAHTISTSQIHERFQRSATFVAENSFILNGKDNIIALPDEASYRYGENQLELFVNGKKLVNTVDYEEGAELEIKEKGTLSKSFALLEPAIHAGVLNYRVTKSIYSYDTIKELFDELQKQINELRDETRSKVQELTDAVNSLNDLRLIVNNYIEKVNSIESGMKDNTVSEKPTYHYTSKQLVYNKRVIIQNNTASYNDFFLIIDAETGTVLNRITEYTMNIDSSQNIITFTFIKPVKEVFIEIIQFDEILRLNLVYHKQETSEIKPN